MVLHASIIMIEVVIPSHGVTQGSMEGHRVSTLHIRQTICKTLSQESLYAQTLRMSTRSGLELISEFPARKHFC